MKLDTSRLGAWAALPFFDTDLCGIEAALDDEVRDILPPPQETFAALETTQPDRTRVVILGQDPYPTPGHANGLCFSVHPGVRPLPRSLANIYRELEADLGDRPATGDLSPWAHQGVLLLNTALTVPEGRIGGHLGIGWRRLAEQVIRRLDDRPRAFLLWGRKAQELGRLAGRADHLKIETAHPSPMSAGRGFFGSRPFSRINAWLAARGEPAIAWV